ncbi:MAG: hypothetical protein LQ340_001270 [Diploschistes diacapsis]|nr:MAG: hypothetical protein LQ340_001270 [Diploschistes diacapsis]
MRGLVSKLAVMLLPVALAMPSYRVSEDAVMQRAAEADEEIDGCSPDNPEPSAASSTITFTSSSSSIPTGTASSTAPASVPTSGGQGTNGTTGSSSSISAQIGKGKRGIIMPLDDPDDIQYYIKAFTSDATPKITWTSNYYSAPSEGLDPKIQFIPQRYNVFASDDANWEINAEKALEAGNNIFFSYGEPGLTSSHPMDAQTGANDWMQQLQNWTTAGATVGAPCMLTNDADFDWLESFLGYCTGCDIGFIAIHWINTLDAGGAPSSIANFKEIVNKAIGIAKGKPVWVDNILASGAHADTTAFLSEIVPWLESNDNVARYAYSGPARTDSSSLLNPDGSISALGSFYANL